MMMTQTAAPAANRSLAELRARDIMQADVRTVHLEAPLMHAARVMGEHGIRHLVVTDTFGRPIGVFSERDMLRHIASCAARGHIVPGRIPVREVMSPTPVTVAPDEPLPHVAAVLAANKIGCVPVTDKQGVLVGIVSVVDVLRSVAATASAVAGV